MPAFLPIWKVISIKKKEREKEMHRTIDFPNLGIHLKSVGDHITVFGFDIAYYGIVIGIGILAGLMLAVMEAKRTHQNVEDYYDLAIYGVIFSIIGARAYYVIFSWDMYKDDIKSIINIREGGLAIYGGVITAIIVVFIFAKIKKLVQKVPGASADAPGTLEMRLLCQTGQDGLALLHGRGEHQVVGGDHLLNGGAVLLGQGVALGGAVPANEYGGDALGVQPLAQQADLLIAQLEQLHVEPAAQILIVAAAVFLVTGKGVQLVISRYVDRFDVQLLAAHIGQDHIKGNAIVLQEHIGVQPAGLFIHACLLLRRGKIPAAGLLVVGDGELGKSGLEFGIAGGGVGGLHRSGGGGQCGRSSRSGHAAAQHGGSAQTGDDAPEQTGRSHKSILLSIFEGGDAGFSIPQPGGKARKLTRNALSLSRNDFRLSLTHLMLFQPAGHLLGNALDAAFLKGHLQPGGLQQLGVAGKTGAALRSRLRLPP